MLTLGYVIVYTPDVQASVLFYERAFGVGRRFVDPEGLYGEVETGTTTLAFAADEMAARNKLDVRPNRPAEVAAGIELAFVTPDVEAGYERAIAAGAIPVSAPEVKPWGQTVSYQDRMAAKAQGLHTPTDDEIAGQVVTRRRDHERTARRSS